MSERLFGRRGVPTVLVLLAGAVLIWMTWQLIDVLLLLFIAFLVAVLLRALAKAVQRRSPLGYRSALLTVGVGLIVLFGLAGWLVAPSLMEQIAQFRDRVPELQAEVESFLRQFSILESVVDQAPEPGELLRSEDDNLFTRITGVFSQTLSAVTNLFIILVVALFLAYDPQSYRRGILALVPPVDRLRASELLSGIVQTLERWLVGRFITMAVDGGLTAIGLWLLGVPLALTLGLLAFLLAFIPYLGAILAFIPAVLIALSISPQLALYVVGLFLIVETVDSYVAIPLVQHRAVDLPPAAIIVSQVILGVLVGGLGVALATPLAAVGLVLVRKLYIEDVLGEEAALPGGDDED